MLRWTDALASFLFRREIGALKTDKEILTRLDSTLLTAQAFPPTYISTPVEAGLHTCH